LAAGLVLAACVAPASATVRYVSVTFRANVGDPAVPYTMASCTVSIPEGSDGVAILTAAKGKCIDSYATKKYDFGTFLACIDAVCGEPNGSDAYGADEDFLLTFWRMFLNGKSTSYGLDSYGAAQGDVLEFSYAPSVVCFVPC
jgi:hypothetical protein